MGKNKKIMIGIVALLISIMACTGIFAYLSAQTGKINRFTFGENVIETDEHFPDPDPKPGGTVEKDVKVKNTGDVPCFVRTKILFSNDDAGLVSTLDINTADWEKNNTDGYYYYKHILPVNVSTSSLMKTVKIADNADLDGLDDFDIIVYSESVQSDGYTDAQYLEAFKGLTH